MGFLPSVPEECGIPKHTEVTEQVFPQKATQKQFSILSEVCFSCSVVISERKIQVSEIYEVIFWECENEARGDKTGQLISLIKERHWNYKKKIRWKPRCTMEILC